MALLTFYDAVTPDEIDQVEPLVGTVLEQLGYDVTKTVRRDDGSRLIDSMTKEGAPGLGVWLVPVQPGTFEPIDFDDEPTAETTSTFRTICKVGAREAKDPRVAVLSALAMAAELAHDGRVYDLHAKQAMGPEDAARIAREPFDVSRFLTYHYIAPPSGDAEHSWIHLHGMAKFFQPDLEAFDVHPDVSHRALSLLQSVAAEMAAGVGPEDSTPRTFGRGAYRLVASEEVRPDLEHFSAEELAEEHDGAALAVEDAGHLGSLTLLLRGAYEMEPKSLAECEAERLAWQERLVDIRAAWERAGEEQVVLRAGLAVGKEGAVEHIWLEVDEWGEEQVRGRLLNDAFGDPAMTRGKAIAFDPARISGVSVFRGTEILHEVEALRFVDPASAELLDSALEPAEQAPVAVVSSSPDGTLEAIFEDDGRAAYVRLVKTEDGTPACEPVWVYNRRATPPVLDLRCLDKGMLPLMSSVYTRQRGPDEAPSPSAAEIVWSGDAAMLLLDGEPWTIVIVKAGRGWSRLIEVAGRYGRPWAEAEEQVMGTRPEERS